MPCLMVTIGTKPMTTFLIKYNVVKINIELRNTSLNQNKYIYVTSYIDRNVNTMFFDQVGKMALGSRMRMVSERLMDDAAKIYPMYGTDLKPKWFPVFYVLSHQEKATITQIAQEIGHTHPSVSKTVREMAKEGVVLEKKDPKDGRVNWITLTPKGQKAAETIKAQYQDLTSVVEEMMAQSSHDIWESLKEFEYLLDQQSMYERVRAMKKRREAGKVQIIDYTPEYSQAFHDINMEWVERYFEVEEMDRKTLENPQSYVIDPGGYIAVALYEGEPLGVCALIKMDDPEYDFELAKMGVSPKAQGLGLGYLLGKAVLDKAKEMGAQAVYLESNTILKPAISLYHKLGFQKVAHRPTPYARANIQMSINV